MRPEQPPPWAIEQAVQELGLDAARALDERDQTQVVARAWEIVEERMRRTAWTTDGRR